MCKIDSIRDDNGKLPAHAWPGSYPMFYVVCDDGILCPDCSNEDKQCHIVGYSVNWEDESMTCDHCSKRIESAYGEPS